jgi:hypothetical protein
MQKFDTNEVPDYVKVRQISYGLENSTKYNYTLYNLESEYIPNFNLRNRIYRSAILSGNRLLALAPSKSLSNDVLQDAVPESHHFSATEIIEGTMVNMFWDPNAECWEIATKKGIGGNYYFFRSGLDEPEQKTFRQMFFEAFVPLNNLSFDKSYSYTFVLQHPCNHIVLMVDVPALYFVHSYKIDGETNTYAYVNPRMHPNYQDFVILGVKFPREFSATDKLVDDVQTALSNPTNDYRLVGYMVTDQNTGFRSAYYNKKYLEVKCLRGNNPNLHYQYLMLRKIGKVSEFLRYFPIYRKHFNKFFEHFRLFSERIYKLYWEVHVKKTLQVFDLVNKQDRFFVEKLHYNVFLPKHKEDAKFFVNRKIVSEFLDGENMMILGGLRSAPLTPL